MFTGTGTAASSASATTAGGSTGSPHWRPPLGIEIDLDGRLLVCDAHRGVLRVDPRTGGIEAVTDRIGVRR